MSDPLAENDAHRAPSRTALLVIDIQNDFVHPEGWVSRHSSGGPPLRRIIPTVNDLIAEARQAGVTVVYVTMEHGPEIDAPNYRARYADRGMDAEILCRSGTWGAELDAALAPPRTGDIHIVRHTYDGFARTDLEARLKARGIAACVATGVVTNLCVQTTIQHAFALGFYVTLVSDGTAAATEPEHELTLDAFRRFFGPVTTAKELAETWRRSAGATAA